MLLCSMCSAIMRLFSGPWLITKDLRNLRGKNGIFAAGFLKFAKLGVCYAAKNWKICKITRMLCGDKNKLKTSFFYCYMQSDAYNLNHVDFLSYIT